MIVSIAVPNKAFALEAGALGVGGDSSEEMVSAIRRVIPYKDLSVRWAKTIICWRVTT